MTVVGAICVAVSLLGATPSARPAPATPLPRAAVISHALVSALEDVDVAAQESGLLTEVHVGEGSVVQRNQLLAQIDDRQPVLQRRAAERERNAALKRAQDDVDVRLAQAALDVAAADLAADEAANQAKPGTIPQTAIRQQKLAKRKAELLIEKSQLDAAVAQLTAEVHEAAVEAADNSIQRRKVASPTDGEVLARLKERGEWVNAGEPVVRLIRMDRLKVEGLLPAADFDPAELIDRPVRVEVELAHGRRATFLGVVTHISPLVTAGNKYRVRAEIENRSERNQWLVRPGMSAVAAIELE